MKVRIILVSYFGSRDAVQAVRSLLVDPVEGTEIVIVDNSQDPEELARLTEVSRSPEVRVHRASENLGYLGAARAVLAEVDEPADWTVVANTDLVFNADFVRTLAAEAADAVLAPTVRTHADGADQNPYLSHRPGRGARLRWRLAFARVSTARLYLFLDYWLRRFLPARAPRAASPGSAMYAPHGCCLILPRRYFEAGGSLEHPTLLFAEEITIGETCRRLGIPVLYAPQLALAHREHASTGRWRAAKLLRIQQESIRYANDLLSSGD